MIDVAAWETANARYLSASLSLLRARLARRAGDECADDDLAVAAAGLLEAQAKADAAPALVLLAALLGLSKFEQNVLLLCVAAEFDSSFSSLCARAQGDPSRTYATFALALSIFDEPAWDALSPERPLRYWKLIEINQPGAQALTTSALRADERIVNYLKGLNYLDDRLSPYLTIVEPPESSDRMAASQREMRKTIVSQWQQAGTPSLTPVVQLLGADAAGKLTIAACAAADIRRRLYRLAPEALPAQPADLEVLARLWQRESILLPIALYIDAQELDASDAHTAPVRRLLARSDGHFMLAVREAWPRLARDSFVVDVTKPTMEEQREAWQSIIGGDDVESPGLLASQFNLNIADIEQIARIAKRDDGPNGAPLSERLWNTCRARVRPLLDALAQRLEPKATWNDIVLPGEETSQLQQIAAQVNHRSQVYGEWGFARKMTRGLGISALFAGESGTGKTMAAEVIANGLRLNLYRIDLSAVVSKYIGETEKNLRRLFDAAEDGGAILFFDEADALFGKRSEVKDSHDRYANIEINYLLQRMEAYRGLAILATNMRAAMDLAFTRRLRFIVNFPFPGVAERKRMWQRAFPPQTPVRQLDYDRLARLNLTGGSIHNAALHAAFLGAQAGSPVTMQFALAAAKAEFVKLDRPINEADFRWLEPTGVVA
jgi:ATPase family associated with various cellular activities (AAA)/Winged helix domain, variant